MQLSMRSDTSSLINCLPTADPNFMSFITRTFLVSVLILASPFVGSAEPKKPASSALSPSDIFRSSNIWTIHLRFTPDEWEAMEPKQAARQQRGFGGNWLQGP